MANLKEIQEFLENLAKTDLHKVKIKTDEIELTVQLKPDVKVTSMPQNFTPQVSFQPSQSVSQKNENIENKTILSDNDGLLTIKSPMVGTFYRKPAPDKPAFIEIGQNVNSGDVICIIEAMKLFNEIESELSGELVKVLVEDGTPVEYDQPLFLVKS
ncbi:MAG: acetyl-CoA carboxylase biotin carboxyl carrier protein [Bacteroidales bacterium]|nr:acetyl-CoA carboxylase biotin carboxyl carrier protein [Bacteroidales bacterium]